MPVRFRTYFRQVVHLLALCVLALLTGCGRAAKPEPSTAAGPNADAVEVRVLPSRVVSSSASAPLTPEQGVLRTRLEKQCADERPTNRLTLRNGRVVEGRIVDETSSRVRLREGFGFSGYVIAPYKRSEIVTIETLPAESFQITRRDVELCQEFPRYHFAKIPPYSFVTDESFGDVERILRLLTDLRQQFEVKFAPLIAQGAAPQDIAIIFFGAEDAFRGYARRVAPSFVNSAGFYASSNNRLALLNQLGTQRYAEIGSRLAKHQHDLDDRHDVDPADQYQASRRLTALRSEITFEAKSMTERLIRHEGAHQLFHSYRIHSRYGLEPTWLTEGLAEYCEPGRIGGYNSALAERLVKLRTSNSLLPLKTLLTHRDPAGFFSLGEEATDAGYAQSWALVYFLMQDEFRGRFFDFIKRYRDIKDSQAAQAMEDADSARLLESCLKINHDTLETQWRAFMNHL
jgi:hypothetical protein